MASDRALLFHHKSGHGEYTAPRACPCCPFRTLSRDEYWRHWFAEHGNEADRG